MSQHVPEDLLQAFVEGDVGEQLAIHIAEHLDGCPACSTRAAGMEPLAAAFAAVEDPVPPPGLTQAVLARVDEPDRVPMLEIGVGVGLLVCAAGLAVGLDGPFALAAQDAVLLNAAATMGRGVGHALGAFQLALVGSTLLAAIGCAVTFHFAALPSHSSSALRRSS